MLDIDQVDWWTFDLVREALVETATLWRRSPGEGRSPFAADGPWHLMSRKLSAGDYDARGGLDQAVDEAPRPLPLSRAEVELRDRISEWLSHVATPEDRRLLVTVIAFYASGYQQVPWRKVRRKLSIDRGEYGLQKRFQRSITAIASGLNAVRSSGDAQIGDKK